MLALGLELDGGDEEEEATEEDEVGVRNGLASRCLCEADRQSIHTHAFLLLSLPTRVPA